MKPLLLSAAAALLALAACNNSNNANNTAADSTALNGDSIVNTASGSDTGWTPLFNGSSLSNWHNYGKNAPGSAWHIDSNSIHLVPTGNEGGDLLTNDEYGNFDLKLQWKISKGGNSGILFYVQEDTSRYKETYFTGPEMQVLDNNGHPDAKIIKHRAGDLCGNSCGD